MDLVPALLPLLLLAALLAAMLRLSRRQHLHAKRPGAQYDLGPGRPRQPGDRAFAVGAPYGSGS